MCLRERNRTHVPKAVAAPPPSLVVLNPLRAYAIDFHVWTIPLPKHLLVHLHPFQLHITWQVGDFLYESEALNVSLLNLILKTDDAKWLCLW